MPSGVRVTGIDGEGAAQGARIAPRREVVGLRVPVGRRHVAGLAGRRPRRAGRVLLRRALHAVLPAGEVERVAVRATTRAGSGGRHGVERVGRGAVVAIVAADALVVSASLRSPGVGRVTANAEREALVGVGLLERRITVRVVVAGRLPLAHLGGMACRATRRRRTGRMGTGGGLARSRGHREHEQAVVQAALVHASPLFPGRSTLALLWRARARSKRRMLQQQGEGRIMHGSGSRVCRGCSTI